MAAAEFSRPKSFVKSALSDITACNGLSLSVKLLVLSVSRFISTPAAVNSSLTSFGKKRPCARIDITFRNATPPSAPFFPALSSTCMAAFVSAKETPADLAIIPHCCRATWIVGNSADPSFPAAAMMFIISAIFLLASIGSSSETPYWFMAVVRTVAAAVASPPIVLLRIAMLRPISCIAAGVFANSGDSCDRSSLYDSTA